MAKGALVWLSGKTCGVYAVQGSLRVLILLLALCPGQIPEDTMQRSAKQRELLFGQLGQLLGGASGKELSADAGEGRAPGGGHGHPLQRPCLENPMDRGGLQSTVSPKSRTQQ